ncbi:MAG: tetratricopeptide repeat protein [Planctomycetes bacterium]|nr:tetratricopeptide repeat protein [Planctomycetota bacterium]
MQAEDIYLFRHVVVRDAAYQLMPLTRRGELHSDAISIVEAHGADGHAEALAYHARLAAESAPGDARLKAQEVTYTRRAAEDAERRHLPTYALTHWRRVQELADDRELLIVARLGEASALKRLGRQRECDDVQRDCLELARGGVSADLFCQAADAHINRMTRDGDLDHAEALIHEALRRDPGQALRGRLLVQQAGLLSTRGEPEEAEQVAAEALQCVTASGDLRGIGRVKAELASIVARTPEGLARGRTLYTEAIEAFRASGEVGAPWIAQHNMAVMELNNGDGARAEKLLLPVLERAREIGAEDVVRGTLGNLASCYQWFLGRLPEAGELLRRQVNSFREHGSLQETATAIREYARWHSEMGNEPEALALLTEAIGKYRRVKPGSLSEAFCLALIGGIKLHAGDTVQAEQSLRMALDMFGDTRGMWKSIALRDFGKLLFVQGRLASARDACVLSNEMGASETPRMFLAASDLVSLLLLQGDFAGAGDLTAQVAEALGTDKLERFYLTVAVVPQLRLEAWHLAHGEQDALTRAESLHSDLLDRAARGDFPHRASVARALAAADRLMRAMRTGPGRLFRGHALDELSEPCRAALADAPG